jgi:hypothetical protein
VIAAVLCALALVDAALAGFRASTGRNARIDKRAYYLRAAARGFAGRAVGLGLVALLACSVLGTAADSADRYGDLVRAGTRMLQVLAPFAVLVVLALLAYLLLPMRESTFTMLVGLGPFTLVRPVVVVAATAWSVVGADDWLVWAVAVTAATGVLAVEPTVHRRWYSTPL